MELVTQPFITLFNDGLDSELDPIGVSVEHETICAGCLTRMNKPRDGFFRCLKCGMAYNELEDR